MIELYPLSKAAKCNFEQEDFQRPGSVRSKEAIYAGIRECH